MYSQQVPEEVTAFINKRTKMEIGFQIVTGIFFLLFLGGFAYSPLSIIAFGALVIVGVVFGIVSSLLRKEATMLAFKYPQYTQMLLPPIINK